MTITQQDRLLAERILDCRKAFTEYDSPDYIEADMDVEAIASLLAEAREAQHKASWAMAIEATIKVCDDSEEEEDRRDSYGNERARTCSRIADTIRALPTPPITNEGE